MASGLALAGGADGNDPVRATTTGTGQLIAAAVKAGARQVLVGMGGSATTDGGWGALEALEPHSRLAGIDLQVACDVRDPVRGRRRRLFPAEGGVAGAGRRCSPAAWSAWPRSTRSASASTSGPWRGRARRVGWPADWPPSGPRSTSGFDLVAERIDLADRIEGADLVITGEGLLDDQSFDGKAVGGVVALAAELGVPVLVLAGDAVGDAAVDRAPTGPWWRRSARNEPGRTRSALSATWLARCCRLATRGCRRTRREPAVRTTSRLHEDS